MPARDKVDMTNDCYDDLTGPLGNLVIAFNELEIAMGGGLHYASRFARFRFAQRSQFSN
jgi:hypothetical protein